MNDLSKRVKTVTLYKFDELSDWAQRISEHTDWQVIKRSDVLEVAQAAIEEYREERDSQRCEWTRADDFADGTTMYDTECGASFRLNDDRPLSEMNMEFCPLTGCGKRIQLKGEQS